MLCGQCLPGAGSGALRPKVKPALLPFYAQGDYTLLRCPTFYLSCGRLEHYKKSQNILGLVCSLVYPCKHNQWGLYDLQEGPPLGLQNGDKMSLTVLA